VTGPSEPERAEAAAWLVDTGRRLAVRYGRALAALAQVPPALHQLGVAQSPDDPVAEEGADGIEVALTLAVQQLDRMIDYAEAITDPGQPYCTVCGARVLSPALDPGTVSHWRETEREVMPWEPYDAGHEAVTGFRPPVREPWVDVDLDGGTRGGEPR
jgi:hypothetical protein